MNTGYQTYPQPQAYPQQYSQLQPSGFLNYTSNEMVVFGILAIIGYVLYTSYLKSKKSPDADADAAATAADAAAAADADATATAAAAAADADATATAADATAADATAATAAAACKQYDDYIACSLDEDGKVYSFWGNMGSPNEKGGYGGCSSNVCEWFTTKVGEGSSCEDTCSSFTKHGFNYGGSYETVMEGGASACGCVSSRYMEDYADKLYWNRPNIPGHIQYVKNTFRGNFKLPSQTQLTTSEIKDKLKNDVPKYTPPFWEFY